MKEPVDHILRPQLPWRPPGAGITECGFNAASVKTLTRDEFFARLREYGRQRTAVMTCMTCSDTAQRWATWEQEPRQMMEREIAWEGARFHSWAGRERFSDAGRGQQLQDELLAIADLIEAHRADFDRLIAERQGRRQWLAKKQAVQKPPRYPL
jgi:hypothetical protein